jgi:hypothetical protein
VTCPGAYHDVAQSTGHPRRLSAPLAGRPVGAASVGEALSLSGNVADELALGRRLMRSRQARGLQRLARSETDW